MNTSLILPVLLVLPVLSHAQNILSGKVTESGKNIKLENVFVRDMNSKEVALSNKSGAFDIRTQANHTLILSLSGYISDTLYLIDMKPKHIELRLQGINLRTVNIHNTNVPFNPRKEYPQVYEKSKFALSPSRIFGKESRDARRLKRYFEREQEQRQIDAIFTKAFVSSIVPLKGKALEDFMAMYRPTLSFVKNSSRQTLTIYVNDSYRKFMALPPDKRSLPGFK